MRKLLLAGILLLLSQTGRASHIVGGELTYKYQRYNSSSGTDVYDLSLSLYVDCVNGQPAAIEQDRVAYFNVFDAKTGQLLTDLCLKVLRFEPERVSATNYKCIRTIPNACVDFYRYETSITLPRNTNGYIISFERCCRNNTISNILFPESTGATYWTEIRYPGFTGKNSSPVFKSLPPNFLCTNAPLVFDHAATDEDDDSLVYELFTPYIGAGTGSSRPEFDNIVEMGAPNFPDNSNRHIIWTGGYNQLNMMGGKPILSIDRFSGRLTVTPDQTGQFVVGIKVLEYRKGVLIGETKRDYQFNVSVCSFDVVSSFYVPALSCTDNEVSFTNFSSGAQEYLWDFGDPARTDDTSNEFKPSYTYRKPGKYKARLIAKAVTCIDTFEYFFEVKQNFKTDIGADTLFCFSVQKQLDAGIPGKKYLWSSGETTQSINVSQPGKYWVNVSDAPCISRDTINITVDNRRIDLGPDSVICRDSFVQFTYDGPKKTFKSYLWNDGTVKRKVFIPKLGTYSVSVTTENNCPSSDTITFVLYPPPKPKMRDTSICKGDAANLDVTNPGASYLWNTGAQTASIQPRSEGTYIARIQNKLCTIFDTGTVSFIRMDLELGPDTFYCGKVLRVLNTGGKFKSYLWHDGATDPTYTATTPGIKKVTVTNDQGCKASDSMTIAQHPELLAKIQGDTTICASSELVLTANDSMTYAWNTGETTRSVKVNGEGIYIVVITDKFGCIDSGSVHVKRSPDALPNEMFMPNAFTPNDDHTNDLYPGNRYADPGAVYNLKLFNRWGEKIFDSGKPSLQWDGTYKGEKVPQDVYVYLVTYVGCDNQERSFRGTFTLFR